MVGLPQRLKELAVLRLPSCIAERMSDEWQDHLNSTPGLRAQIRVAMGFVIAAVHFKLATLLPAA